MVGESLVLKMFEDGAITSVADCPASEVLDRVTGGELLGLFDSTLAACGARCAELSLCLTAPSPEVGVAIIE